MHSKLLHIANSKCLPFFTELPQFKPFVDRTSIVLVGSVATGLSREDLDIAIICNPDIYSEITQSTRWVKGIPSETTINGVQFYYYAATFQEIEKNYRALRLAYQIRIIVIERNNNPF